MDERVIIIMAKCPKLGNVKTRLAADVGQNMALDVYKQLLDHNLREAGGVDAKVILFFNDDFNTSIAEKYGYPISYQTQGDLGDRMQNAFWEVFEKGAKQVVMIGADCHDLTTEHIEKAFGMLKINDLVIGPAKDGGYYLIGMNELHSHLLENKPWSTEQLLQMTLNDAKRKNLSFLMLETLNDIDTVEDLRESKLGVEFGIS